MPKKSSVCTLRVRSTGVININKILSDRLNLKDPNTGILFHRDADDPDSWYLSTGLTGIPVKFSTLTQPYLNSKVVSDEILNDHPANIIADCLVDVDNPIVDDDGRMVIPMSITYLEKRKSD